MNFIGMDVHKIFTYAIAKDRDGNILAKEKFDNSENNFKIFLKPFLPEETKIVMESTGVWECIYDVLEGLGYEVKLANPVKTKAIAYARVKTDAVDASTLADLLRANLIAESYIPPKEIRHLRELTRLRKMASKQKTQWMNRLHAFLIKKGIRIPTTTLCKKATLFLKEKNDEMITYYLGLIELFEQKMKTINDKISEASKKKEDVKPLMSIRGISTINAMNIIAEVGDINRFQDAEKFASYVGLVPSVKQSGNTLRFGTLIKQASRTLKNAFIQAAWVNVRARESNPVKEHYLKLAKKKGKQKAICGAARKLCCITYAVLKKKEVCRYS